MGDVGAAAAGEDRPPGGGGDGVEAVGGGGQVEGARWPPLAPLVGPNRGGVVEHRLVQVGGDDARGCGDGVRQRPRQDAGSGGDLQHPIDGLTRHPRRQVGGVGLEDQRHEIGLVELRDRAGEFLVRVAGGHGR